jgi:hypothetical protein
VQLDLIMNSYVSQFYKRDNDIWGYPQEYKGISFYPLKVKDTKETKTFYRLFTCPKTYIADRQILRMSYLKFLLYVVQGSIDSTTEKISLQAEIEFFLKHVCRIKEEKVSVSFFYKEHLENEDLYEKHELFISIRRTSVEENIILTEQDFDNIREIILEQNGTSVEYIESYNPKLEKDLEFLMGNSEPLNYAEEIFSFCALTKMTEIEAGEKTLFQFSSRLQREMLLKDYEIFKAMESAGFISSKIKSKELFKHYLGHIPKAGRYDSLLLNADEYLKESGLSDPNSNIVIEK